MIGILLYLVNDNNVDKVRNAFESESAFELSTIKPGERAADDSSSKGKDLVIFDITTLDINDRKNIKSLSIDTGSFHKSGLGIIFILDPDQLKILLNNGVTADSFILSPQIETELIPRINFLLLKIIQK